MIFKRLSLVFFTLLFAIVPFIATHAQNLTLLVPGSAQVSSLSSELPIGIFAFSGSTGDLVQIRLVGLASGMNLSASLQNPTQQNIAVSLPQVDGSALVSARLTESGVHSILVGGGFGDYLISFNSVNAASAVTVGLGSSNQMNVSGLTPQIIQFTGSTTSSTSVTISRSNATAYQFSLFDGSGALAGAANNLDLACFYIAPTDSVISAVVTGVNLDSTGAVDVSLGTSCGSAPTITTINPPAPTQVISQPPANTCVAQTGGTVNVRTGAGTDFNILGSLPGGSSVPVIGTTGTGWVQVQTNFGVGFIFQSVISLNGPCGNLPLVSGGTSGQGPAQPTVAPVQPTATQLQGGAPTATLEQGVQPTATQPVAPPTETIIPPTATQAAQIAPPDSNYVLNVNLDSAASISEVVSYPDGDTEDVVSYNANGLNNNAALPGGLADLILSFSCSGTGTEYIQFVASGQTFTCGQTYIRRVNADSDTGAVRVRATGGSATYVQWTINATLPRAN